MSLALSFAIIASGIIPLFGLRQTVGLAIFLLAYGPAWGCLLMLLPLITIESLGLKHYASLGGMLRVAEAAGAMLGPVALGRIFDLTSSYRPAFGLCILCAAVGAAATLGCEKFSTDAATNGYSVGSGRGKSSSSFPRRRRRPTAPHISSGFNS